MSAEEFLRIILYVASATALIVLVVFLLRTMRLLASAQLAVQKTTDVLDKLAQDVKVMQNDLHATFTGVQALTANADTTLSQLHQTVDSLNDRVSGVVQNISAITGHARSITGDAADTVHAAKNSVMTVVDFGQRFERAVNQPVGEVVTILSALARAIRAFRSKMIGDPEPETNGYHAGQADLAAAPVDAYEELPD